MKKALSLILALALVLSMSMNVFAATLNTETSSEVTATYTKDAGYTVTIPDAVTVDGSTEHTVSAAGVIIASDETLKVTITSEDWLVTYAEEDLAYHLNDAEAGATLEVLTVAGGTATGSATFTAALNEGEEATMSGAYTDTLTFTVAVE